MGVGYGMGLGPAAAAGFGVLNTQMRLIGLSSYIGGLYSAVAAWSALAHATTVAERRNARLLAVGVSMANVGNMAAAAWLGLAKQAIHVAGQMEQANVGLTTILGSTERAASVIEGLKGLAVKSPYDFESLLKPTTQLLAMGEAGHTVIKTMTTLGDTMSALGRDKGAMQRLIINLGQVRALGRLTGRDLRDFATLGINVYKPLEQMGIKGKDLAKLPNIPSKIFIPIFLKYLDETYGGGMERQSKTLLGQISAIKDEWHHALADIGKEPMPYLAGMAGAAREMMTAYNHLTAEQKNFIMGAGTVSIALMAITGGLMTATAMWRMYTASQIAAGRVPPSFIGISGGFLRIAALGVIATMAVRQLGESFGWLDSHDSALQQMTVTWGLLIDNANHYFRLIKSLGSDKMGGIDPESGKFQSTALRERTRIRDKRDDNVDAIRKRSDDEYKANPGAKDTINVNMRMELAKEFEARAAQFASGGHYQSAKEHREMAKSARQGMFFRHSDATKELYQQGVGVEFELFPGERAAAAAGGRSAPATSASPSGTAVGGESATTPGSGVAASSSTSSTSSAASSTTTTSTTTTSNPESTGGVAAGLTRQAMEANSTIPGTPSSYRFRRESIAQQDVVGVVNRVPIGQAGMPTAPVVAVNGVVPTGVGTAAAAANTAITAGMPNPSSYGNVSNNQSMSASTVTISANSVEVNGSTSAPAATPAAATTAAHSSAEDAVSNRRTPTVVLPGNFTPVANSPLAQKYDNGMELARSLTRYLGSNASIVSGGVGRDNGSYDAAQNQINLGEGVLARLDRVAQGSRTGEDLSGVVSALHEGVHSVSPAIKHDDHNVRGAASDFEEGFAEKKARDLTRLFSGKNIEGGTYPGRVQAIENLEQQKGASADEKIWSATTVAAREQRLQAVLAPNAHMSEPTGLGESGRVVGLLEDIRDAQRLQLRTVPVNPTSGMGNSLMNSLKARFGMTGTNRAHMSAEDEAGDNGPGGIEGMMSSVAGQIPGLSGAMGGGSSKGKTDADYEAPSGIAVGGERSKKKPEDVKGAVQPGDYGQTGLNKYQKVGLYGAAAFAEHSVNKAFQARRAMSNLKGASEIRSGAISDLVQRRGELDKAVGARRKAFDAYRKALDDGQVKNSPAVRSLRERFFVTSDTARQARVPVQKAVDALEEARVPFASSPAKGLVKPGGSLWNPFTWQRPARATKAVDDIANKARTANTWAGRLDTFGAPVVGIRNTIVNRVGDFGRARARALGLSAGQAAPVGKAAGTLDAIAGAGRAVVASPVGKTAGTVSKSLGRLVPLLNMGFGALTGRSAGQDMSALGYSRAQSNLYGGAVGLATQIPVAGGIAMAIGSPLRDAVAHQAIRRHEEAVNNRYVADDGTHYGEAMGEKGYKEATYEEKSKALNRQLFQSRKTTRNPGLLVRATAWINGSMAGGGDLNKGDDAREKTLAMEIEKLNALHALTNREAWNKLSAAQRARVNAWAVKHRDSVVRAKQSADAAVAESSLTDMSSASFRASMIPGATVEMFNGVETVKVNNPNIPEEYSGRISNAKTVSPYLKPGGLQVGGVGGSSPYTLENEYRAYGVSISHNPKDDDFAPPTDMVSLARRGWRSAMGGRMPYTRQDEETTVAPPGMYGSTTTKALPLAQQMAQAINIVKDGASGRRKVDNPGDMMALARILEKVNRPHRGRQGEGAALSTGQLAVLGRQVAIAVGQSGYGQQGQAIGGPVSRGSVGADGKFVRGGEIITYGGEDSRRRRDIAAGVVIPASRRTGATSARPSGRPSGRANNSAQAQVDARNAQTRTENNQVIGAVAAAGVTGLWAQDVLIRQAWKPALKRAQAAQDALDGLDNGHGPGQFGIESETGGETKPPRVRIPRPRFPRRGGGSGPTPPSTGGPVAPTTPPTTPPAPAGVGNTTPPAAVGGPSSPVVGTPPTSTPSILPSLEDQIRAAEAEGKMGTLPDAPKRKPGPTPAQQAAQRAYNDAKAALSGEPSKVAPGVSGSAPDGAYNAAQRALGGDLPAGAGVDAAAGAKPVAPARVPQPLPLGKTGAQLLPGIVSMDSSQGPRDIVRVQTPGGNVQGFYRSTGANSGAANAGRWQPFEGVGLQMGGHDWFDKGTHVAGELANPEHPLHRMGTPENLEISKELGKRTLKSPKQGMTAEGVNRFLDNPAARGKNEMRQLMREAGGIPPEAPSKVTPNRHGLEFRTRPTGVPLPEISLNGADIHSGVTGSRAQVPGPFEIPAVGVGSQGDLFPTYTPPRVPGTPMPDLFPVDGRVPGSSIPRVLSDPALDKIFPVEGRPSTRMVPPEGVARSAPRPFTPRVGTVTARPYPTAPVRPATAPAQAAGAGYRVPGLGNMPRVTIDNTGRVLPAAPPRVAPIPSVGRIGSLAQGLGGVIQRVARIADTPNRLIGGVTEVAGRVGAAIPGLARLAPAARVAGNLAKRVALPLHIAMQAWDSGHVGWNDAAEQRRQGASPAAAGIAGLGTAVSHGLVKGAVGWAGYAPGALVGAANHLIRGRGTKGLLDATNEGGLTPGKIAGNVVTGGINYAREGLTALAGYAMGERNNEGGPTAADRAAIAARGGRLARPKTEQEKYAAEVRKGAEETRAFAKTTNFKQYGVESQAAKNDAQAFREFDTTPQKLAQKREKVKAGNMTPFGPVLPFEEEYLKNVGKRSSKVFGDVMYTCGDSIAASMEKTGVRVTQGTLRANRHLQGSHVKPNARGNYPEGTILDLAATAITRKRLGSKAPAVHSGIVHWDARRKKQVLLESTGVNLGSPDGMTNKGYYIRNDRTIDNLRGRIVGAYAPPKNSAPEGVVSSDRARARFVTDAVKRASAQHKDTEKAWDEAETAWYTQQDRKAQKATQKRTTGVVPALNAMKPKVGIDRTRENRPGFLSRMRDTWRAYTGQDEGRAAPTKQEIAEGGSGYRRPRPKKQKTIHVHGEETRNGKMVIHIPESKQHRSLRWGPGKTAASGSVPRG